MTLAELLEHYLNTHAKVHKKSWRDDQAMFWRYFGKPPAERKEGDEPPPFGTWRTRKLGGVSEAEVKALHAKVGANHGHYAANRMLALLSVMFNNARLANPTKGVKRFREQERERFLPPTSCPASFRRSRTSRTSPSATSC